MDDLANKIIEILGGILIVVILFYGFSEYYNSKEIVSVELLAVDVTIVDAYYDKGDTFFHVVNGVLIPINESDKYKITVEYNGERYYTDDKETYWFYRDKIGQNTSGIMEVRTYQNGTQKYHLKSLNLE